MQLLADVFVSNVSFWTSRYVLKSSSVSRILRSLFGTKLTGFCLRVLIIAAFLSPSLLVAQDLVLPFKTYSTKEGLSQASISEIFQDSKGFVWLGYQTGIDRFDGVNFESYDLRRYEDSPNIRMVTSIVEDSTGALWFGTAAGGLWKHIPKVGSFEVFLEEAPGNDGLDSDGIRDLKINHEGELIVLTDRGNVFVYDEAASEFSKVELVEPIRTKGLIRIVTSIEVDSDGSFWRIQQNGALENFRIEADHSISNLKEYFLPNIAGIDSLRIWSSFKSKSGNLLFGTVDSRLIEFDPNTSTASVLRIRKNDRHVGNIESIAENRDASDIWIGSDEGILMVDLESRSVRPVDSQTENQSSCDVIRSLMVDQSNYLWAGSFGCGFKRQLKKSSFELYRNDPDDPRSLGGNGIWTLDEDSEGGIWIATNANGINKFDPRTKSFDRFREGNTKGLDSNNIIDLMVDRSNQLWVSSFEGVVLFELVESQNGYTIGGLKRRFNFRSHVWQFRELRNGNVLIGTGAGGAFIYDTPSDSVRHVESFMDDPGIDLQDFGIQGVYEDEKGVIWLGTFGAGLLALDFESKSVQTFDRDEYPFGNVVGTVIKGKNPNEIWIGGYDGLIQLNTETLEVNSWTESSSDLPDDTVYSIIVDDSGEVWISTDKGISRFSPEANSFSNFTTADGLQDMEFNIQSALTASDGTFYLGGINGINAFDYQTFTDSQDAPEVVFTKLRILNKDISPGSDMPISESMPFTDLVTLKPGDNFVEIAYAIPAFDNQEIVQFQYMLEGVDEAWLDNGSRRTLTYTNIPQGSHRLLVRTSVRNGPWLETPSAIGIKMLAPWYKTGWAKVLWFCLGLLLLYLIINAATVSQRRRLQEKENQRQRQELERERATNARLRELDRLKSVFLANMSHEIRTPLTSIIGFADYLSESLPEEHVEYAQYILNGGTRLMDTINSVLDLAQLEGRAVKLSLEALDLSEVIPSYLSLFENKNPKADHVPIVYESEKESGPVAIVDQGALQRVIINLVGNANKFTEEGKITVSTRIEDKFAIIEVRDTGQGIDEEFIPDIFGVFSQESEGANRRHEGSGLGLAITKQLVDLMNGKIEVESTKGVGSVFRVFLPSANGLEKSRAS